MRVWPQRLFILTVVVWMEFEGREPYFLDEGRGALDVLAQVDCDVEDVSMVGSLELEGDYVGRRLTTNYSVPGRFLSNLGLV